ncbi:MAG: transglutaminase-like domain-containing protein [Deltaproteobacteria bacterium]|nr:transglutaminase-like domain-containing protein [Deltaproteobacteria bacterium]
MKYFSFRFMQKAKFERCCYLLSFLLLLLQSGCAWMYFRSGGEPPAAPVHYSLAEWPFEEYWTGVVFNGAKIGFTHLSLAPAEDGQKEFAVRSEAVLHFHFLMFDKKVNFRSFDRVAHDLTLRHFFYDYDMDGNKLKLIGNLINGLLEVEVTSRGETRKETVLVEGKLYPASVIGLYPVFHGLELGRQYEYQVYYGETQSLSKVSQKILAFEESDLFTAKAFKINTELLGQKVTTWIDLQGRPQLEISHGGYIISGLETENEAKKYLAEATINKQDVLLDYSLIKTEIQIAEPEEVTFMEVALSGIDRDLSLPSDEMQHCDRQDKQIICRTSRVDLDQDSQSRTENSLEDQRYLLPSQTVTSHNELIQETAAEITAEVTDPLEKIRLLMEWIEKNIKQEPVDVFTAMDVLSRKKAECQGHTYLYAAFARSLKIPTRVVNGIVYAEEYGGFLYHTWAESLLNGRWIALDPTLGQLPVDGTHLKLVEGETTLDLMALADFVGRLQVRIMSVETF